MALDTFLQQAWAEHGDDPAGVAAQLDERLFDIASAAEVAPFVRLAQHVHAEHLGDLARGQSLMKRIAALPVAAGDAAAQSAVRRALAVLAWCSGDASALDGLERDDRIVVLATAGSAFSGRAEFASAIQSLDAALGLAAAGIADGSPALRALAVAGNNIAAALEEKAGCSAEETQAMLRAAQAGLDYWSRAGTWLETERAHYRLASSRLRAGDAAGAARSAQDVLDVCAAHDAPAFERFLGHAALALALRAAGDAPGFAAERDRALACHGQVPEAERVWCRQEVAELG